MRKKLTNNLGMKLAALALAVMIWLVIQSIADPIIKKDFKDIPVELRNAEILKQQDEQYTYTVVSGGTAAFTVEGPTSIISRLLTSDFSVYADFGKLSQVGAIPVDIVLKRYTSTNVTIRPQTNTLRIELDELVDKTVNVVVHTIGEPGENRTTGTPRCEPNLVKVSGPKKLLETVKELAVTVDISGAIGDISAAYEAKLYDNNNQEITEDTVEIDLDGKINVSIPMLETRTIPVLLDFSAVTVKDGYAIVGEPIYDPKEIVIAGNADDLDKFIENKCQDGVLIIPVTETNLDQNKEGSCAVGDNLSEDIKLVDENIKNQGISYQITVEPKVSATKSITFDNIELLNQNPDFTYMLSDEYDGGKVPVVFSGVSTELDKLNSSTDKDIKISADVGDITEPGTYTVKLTAILPGKVELAKNQEMTIVVEGNNESFK